MSPRSVDANRLIADCARAVFNTKTWAHLVGVLGISERAAKSRVAGERTFTADEIATLLRSEEGIHFLVAIMDEARPKWWAALLRMGLLGGIAQRRAADLRLMRRIANADGNTLSEVPNAIPHSVRVQNPEFVEPFVEAFDAFSRGDDRAMGPAFTKGRGR